MQAIGSRPLHSGHCPQLWLQWTTTSSPTFQRFTWSPTFQTIPEASEPALWNGSPCILKTLTGLPRAAHTPLKFTPSGSTPSSCGTSPSGSVVMGLLVGLDQLQQGAAEGLGMEEGDLVPARAGPGDLVDERHAPGVQAREQRIEIADAQREVVERVAALLQEPLQALVALRRDQLQRRPVGEVEE